MDNSFKQFLIINQVIIKRTSITCSACNKWLTPPIHAANGIIYCGDCTPKKGERIAAMEDLLNNYKYPCINETCGLLLDYKEIDQHRNNCSDAVTCTFCEAGCDKTMISQHLIAEHEAQVIDTDKPKFTLTVNMPLANNLISMYLVEMLNVHFLFFCTQDHNILKATLMKIKEDDKIYSDKYAVHMTTSIGKKSNHEGVLQQFGTPQSSANELEMYFGKAESCNLEVSLGSRQHTDVPECPICLVLFGPKLRQCSNGHSVCDDCGPKINYCPMCRLPMDDKVVNLQCLYPDAMWPCKNYRNGCMAYFNSSEYRQHADVCVFRNINCFACALSIRKCDVMRHMKNTHVLRSNFDTVQISTLTNNSCTVYISFNSEIFECVIALDGSKVEFKCELAYKNLISNTKYCYVFHILTTANATKAAYIRNVGSSSSCFIAQRKLTSQFSSTMFVRCCIFKDNHIVYTPLQVSKTINSHLPRVFFDIADGVHQLLGRIVMELRSDVVPKTVENFLALCTHEKGYGYKGSKFHRIKLNQYCAGGHISKHNHTECVDRFAPDDKSLKYAGCGTLAMCDTSRSCSTFCILMDHVTLGVDLSNSVIFGRVVKGLDVVNLLNEKSYIANCGLN